MHDDTTNTEQNRVAADCPDERLVSWGIDDLKSFAAARCVDIFNDFDATEIAKETTSVRMAWDIGRQIEDLYS